MLAMIEIESARRATQQLDSISKLNKILKNV
jgi:hypothetical protein